MTFSPNRITPAARPSRIVRSTSGGGVGPGYESTIRRPASTRESSCFWAAIGTVLSGVGVRETKAEPSEADPSAAPRTTSTAPNRATRRKGAITSPGSTAGPARIRGAGPTGRQRTQQSGPRVRLAPDSSDIPT
ncbi:hypothetical protein GCM10018790_58450 [Kitasatospora xanthocidica]|nr:hypothetical protein GCM10018790_58450 [Kitasatospora xanthocidica]